MRGCGRGADHLDEPGSSGEGVRSHIGPGSLPGISSVPQDETHTDGKKYPGLQDDL